MPVIRVRVTEDGFQVPPGLARQLGLQPGEEARIEIRRAPDAEAVRNMALRYAWRRLGDAVGVDEPVWDGESWAVPLKVRNCPGVAGRLVLSAEGEVIAGRSATREELLEKVRAACSSAPATR